MPDYSKSVIYKIYDNTNGDTYYGSTCNELRYRIRQHKWKAFSKTEPHITWSRSIILNGDYSYNVVEKYPCENKQQLHTRERWWIENNNCVNKQIPTRTRKERVEANKDTIMKKNKEWYEKNKEHYLKNAKEYRENNKELVQQKDRERKNANRDYILQKINCECGAVISRTNLPKHYRTANHIKLMSCLPCSPPPPSPPSSLNV